jgi:hypothetical protein
MLVFACPSCGAELKLSEDLAGQQVRCAGCNAVVMAPGRKAASEGITGEPPAKTVAGPTSVTPERPRAARAAEADDDVDDRPRRRPRDGGSTAAAVGTGLGIGGIIAIVGAIGACVLCCAGVGIMVALLVPAVQKVREAAARTQTMNNMKMIGIACHSYHDTFGSFPTPKQMAPPANQMVDLSWRVSILPFIEQGALLNQFNASAAWDSPQNQPLLSRMPREYLHVQRDPPQGSTTTFFQYFTGPNTLWPDNSKKRMVDITDGTSNTFLFAEAANGVPWSKGADMAVQPGQPLPLPPDRFMVCFCDGSVRLVDHRKHADPTLLIYINPRDNIPAPPIVLRSGFLASRGPFSGRACPPAKRPPARLALLV